MKNINSYTDFDGSAKRRTTFFILIIILIVILIIFCFCFFKRNDYKIEETNIEYSIENNSVYTTTKPNLYSYSEENNNSYNEDNTYLYSTDNNFYNEENNTLNQLNWSSYNEDNSYSNETTFNSACNNNTSLDLHKGSYNNENNSTFNISSNTKTTIGFVILGICFIGYIIAQILSIRGSLIITTGWLDKLLIIISAIALFINSLASDAEAKDIANTALIIGLITMGISIIISILANIPNPLYIILSILAKFFLFFLTSFIVAIIIVYLIFSFFVSIMSSSSVDSGWHILEYDPWTNAYFGYRKA